MPFMVNMDDEFMREHFTHKGWLAFCPVYIGETEDGELLLSERNGIPEWGFYLAAEFCHLVCFLGWLINPDLEGGFLLRITGEIA